MADKKKKEGERTTKSPEKSSHNPENDRDEDPKT
jgi:hypothetical protein